MSNTSDLFPSLSSLLRSALGEATSPEAETFLDMMSADVLFEFPFAPAGGIDALQGKQALADYLPKVSQLLTIESMSLERTLLSRDCTYAVIEFSCKDFGKATGKRYDQDYVSVIDIKDGFITRYKDYWNPLAVIEAIGNGEQLSTTLKGDTDD